MAERFAEAIYELLEGTNPSFPDDCKRFLSGVQDVAGDYPREKKSLGRFADDHFIEICAAAGKTDEEDIPQVISRATDYLQSEYLLEESWAAHLSEEFVLAMWAHGHGESPEWIGDQHPAGAIAAGAAGSAARKAGRPQKPIDERAGETEMIDDPVTGPRRETFPEDDGPEIIGAAGAGAGAYGSGGYAGTNSGGAGNGGGRGGLRAPHIIGIVLIAAALAFGLAFLFGLNSCNDDDKDSGTETTTEATQEKDDSGEEANDDSDSGEAAGENGSGSESGSEALAPTDRVFAHRGTGGAVDSFNSYDSAIQQGATHFEQDVVYADDGQLYVAKGSISPYTVPASQVAGNIRLRDVFEHYGKDYTFVVELKTTSAQGASALVDLIREYKEENNVIVQCFESGILSQVKGALPQTETMYLCDNNHNGQAGVDSALSMAYVDIIGVSYNDGMMNMINRDAVHGAGKKLCAWSLDDVNAIRQAIDLGVDCYFTVIPGEAIAQEKSYR